MQRQCAGHALAMRWPCAGNAVAMRWQCAGNASQAARTIILWSSSGIRSLGSCSGVRPIARWM
jgi:hypothetical protein